MATLYELSADMLAIERELEDNGGELTPELEAIMNDTQESIQLKADGYRSLIAKLDARCDAIDKEIERLQKLKKTTSKSRQRIADHVLNVMRCFGLDRIEGKFCKFSIRKSSKLNVDDELVQLHYRSAIDTLKMQLPGWMTISVKVGKTALKDAFKDTDILPVGCEWEKTESLIIR